MKQNRDNEESLLSAAHLHSFSARVLCNTCKAKDEYEKTSFVFAARKELAGSI